MERTELHVEIRGGVGKGESRRLRAQCKVPVILYGPHMDNPIPLSVNEKDLRNAIHHKTNTLFTLRASGEQSLDGKLALIKEEQFHPLDGKRVHVDLYEVRMDEKIKVSVRLVLVGKAKGIQEGGILEQILRELEVRCLPNDIPEKIDVDVSGLGIGDSMHLSDVALPQGVSILGGVNYTVAAVVPPDKEEIPQVAQAEAVPTAEVGAGTPATQPQTTSEGASQGAAQKEASKGKETPKAKDK